MSKTENQLFDDVNSQTLRTSMNILRAITHPLRLKIIGYIDKQRKVSVHKIYTSLNLDQSIASQQLHILRSADMVITHREGKFIFYSLNYDTIKRVNDLVEGFRAEMKSDK